MPNELSNDFDEAMFSIYVRALHEVGYRANRYFQMLQDHGGLETAKILISSTHASEGYKALWERRRLDLTVEALIHDDPKWHPLFTAHELEIVKKRLIDYEYDPASEKL